MSRKWLFAVLVSLILTGALGALVAHDTPALKAAQPAVATPVDAGLPRWEVGGEVESSAISPIDSPNPTCYRPVAGTGICYVQWGYMNVTSTAGAYVISMTVTIDNRLRAYHSGFFQTAMYVPGDMVDPGYRVACGAPGSGGVTGMGKIYSYAIRARDTTGLTAANYGSVTCPADTVHALSPLIRKQAPGGGRHIQIEAEAGQIIAPMVAAAHAGASGGRFVHTPPDKYEGEVRLDIQIPRAGKYAIWGRVWGMDSGQDSFWASVDGGSEAQWGIPHDAWTWSRIAHWNGSQSVPVIYDLSAGVHHLRIRTREHGSRLDVLHITDDLGWIPQ